MNPIREELNIKSVTEMTGLSAFTLRAWESRHHVVSPSRSETGRRLYSWDDVEKLRLLVKLTERGHSIGSVAHLGLGALKKFLVERNGHQSEGVGWAAVSEPILEAVENFNLSELDLKIGRARAKFAAKDFALKVAVPLLAHTGKLVASGSLNVAQEHAFSACLRDHLASLYHLLAPSYGRRPIVLCTTPEGELHEFGSLISAILAAEAGLETHYLGPNLPVSDLASATKSLRAQVLVFGVSPQFSHTSLRKYATEISKLVKDDAEIWVGGPALPKLGSLKSKVKSFTSLESYAKEVELL